MCRFSTTKQRLRHAALAATSTGAWIGWPSVRAALAESLRGFWACAARRLGSASSLCRECCRTHLDGCVWRTRDRARGARPTRGRRLPRRPEALGRFSPRHQQPRDSNRADQQTYDAPAEHGITSLLRLHGLQTAACDHPSNPPTVASNKATTPSTAPVEVGDPANDPRRPQRDPDPSEDRCRPPHHLQPVRTDMVGHNAKLPAGARRPPPTSIPSSKSVTSLLVRCPTQRDAPCSFRRHLKPAVGSSADAAESAHRPS